MRSAPPVDNNAKPWWVEDDDDDYAEQTNKKEEKAGDESESDYEYESNDGSVYHDNDYDNDDDTTNCGVGEERVGVVGRDRNNHWTGNNSSPPRSSVRDSPPSKTKSATATDDKDNKQKNRISLQAKLSRTTKLLSHKVSDKWNALRDIKPKATAAAAATSAPASLTSASTSGPQRAHSQSSRRSSSSSSCHTNHNSTNNPMAYRRYTVQELIQSMEHGVVDLPPALERRVRDFKFAQQKRRERSGGNEQRHWGIFGLYAHLSDIRADLEWAEDAAWRRQRSEPYLSWTDFEKGRDKGFNNRPWFIYSVLAICTIMMIVTVGVNGWKLEPLNVNPLMGPSSDTLINVGARQSDLIVNQGQYFRLFTPIVLHAGFIHYIINMLALYFIGGAVEQSHGWLSACVLFAVPAVGGNILSAICLPQYISVGASGGIFGLIGGCLADIAINWNLLFLKSTTEQGDRWRHGMVLFWLASDILINCIIGLTPFVDNFTHLGGLVYGLLCGLSTIEKLAVGFFGLESQQGPRWKMYLLRFLGLIASILSIMITTVVLVHSDGVTSPCSGCRYISCVPFPPNADDKWWECDDCDFVTADLFTRPEDGMYEEIALTCPDGQIEAIDVSGKQWYEKDHVRKALPSYCRDVCENVFATKH
jgi:membrane associated rhomboid family serine protease